MAGADPAGDEGGGPIREKIFSGDPASRPNKRREGGGGYGTHFWGTQHPPPPPLSKTKYPFFRGGGPYSFLLKVKLKSPSYFKPIYFRGRGRVEVGVEVGW